MPLFNCVNGIDIPEIVCALPSQKFSLHEYAPNLVNEKTAKRMARETGFYSLSIAPEEITTADLFAFAAEKLLSHYNREKISALVFVTKTPDYDLPATSHILQNRLGLSNNILCIDINEGCSGFIKGLYIAASLSRQTGASVLLGCGDTNSKIASPDDRATRCIYGDGAAAILVTPGNQNVPFAFASYGENYDAIIIENSRGRITKNPRNNGYISLDGIEILNFSLNEVPEVINDFLSANNLNDENISLYACHQANKLIINSLADKLKVSNEKMPFNLGDIGNISSASIPLVMARSDKSNLPNVLCCGFGVGLAVGTCLANFSGTNFTEVYLS